MPAIKQRTNVRVDPGLSEERNEGSQQCCSCTWTLLAYATFGHMDVNILVVKDPLVRRSDNAEVIRVSLNPAERNLSTFADDFAELASQLQRSLSRHDL